MSTNTIKSSISELFGKAASTLLPVVAVVAGLAYTEIETKPAQASTLIQLAWDRVTPPTNSGVQGVKINTWEYNGLTNTRLTTNPIVTTVPDTVFGLSSNVSIILDDGKTFEMHARVYTSTLESDPSNTIYPVTQGTGPMRGAQYGENTFFLNQNNPAYMYGGEIKDVVYIRNQSSYAEGFLYGGDDLVESGSTGSINVFDLGSGNDQFALNGANSTITGGPGKDIYLYTLAQSLATGAAAKITDFNPAQDVFEIRQEVLENQLYFPNADTTTYLGLARDPANPANVELWVNPWGYGFGTNVNPAHVKKAAVFLNASNAFHQVDPNFDSVEMVTDMIATGNLVLKRQFGEVTSGRNQYANNVMQTIPNFSPTNGSSLILPWVPGFPALTNDVGNIDRFVMIVPDPTNTTTALVLFNPFGRGMTQADYKPIAVLPGTMPALNQLKLPTDTSVAAAMKRTGNIFALKLMNEYVIDHAAFNANIVKILTVGGNFDPYEGDRIVITHAPGFTPGASNVDDFFGLVNGSSGNTMFAGIRPYIGSSLHYVVRFDNASPVFPSLPRPGQTIGAALQEIGALHIIPAPAPPRPPIVNTFTQVDYGPSTYRIINYGTQFNPPFGDSITINYAPGFTPGVSRVDDFVSFVPGSNGTSLFGRLKPSSGEAFDYIFRLDGAAAALNALPDEPGETIAAQLYQMGALKIQHLAPHVPVMHTINRQVYDTGPYKIIRFGEEFNPALGDNITLTYAPGFNPGAPDVTGDVDAFSQFVIASNGTSVFLRQRPNFSSAWRYVARIDNAAAALSALPDEPYETIAEALEEIGAFDIAPAP